MIRYAFALISLVALGCSSAPAKQASFPTLEADSENTGAKREQTSCPDNVMSGAKEQGGACLDTVVLGQPVVEACASALNQAGWKRDEVSEKSMGRSKDRLVVCFRKP